MSNDRLLQEVAEALIFTEQRGPVEVPPRDSVVYLAHAYLDVLFAEQRGVPWNEVGEVREGLRELVEHLEDALHPLTNLKLSHETIIEEVMRSLPRLRELLKADAEATLAGDPAATSLAEVIVAYPGFFAVAVYRLAHEILGLKVPLLPRMLTEYAHSVTGIDIHPGATIGPRFCIDHGSGVVIGETAIIGADVRIYQGVTLGALAVSKNLANQKRHPTVEDRVTIYAGATILGGDTVIGAGAVIGGGVWVTESVASGAVVRMECEV